VPTVFLQHTRVSRGGLVHEQKDPKVRGGVGIANPSSSIVLSYGPRHPATPFPRRSSEQDHNTSKKLLDPPIESLRSLNTGTSSPWQKPTTATTGHREKYFSGYSPPTTIPWRASSSPTEPRHRRALLIADLVRHGHSLFAHSHPQPKLPKVCPDSLNLPSAGNPFCRNIVVIFLFFVFPDQGLNCFDLESSRVFAVRFPKLSLFQLSELLHFIDFSKKFIKIQNQFYLIP
jgi:hypothetical protein